MDPNNNQPINTNPLGQQSPSQPMTTPSPATPPAQPSQPAGDQNIPVASKSNKRIIILLVILVLLIAGMGFYVFFVQKQLNITQKTSTENASVVIPTATPIPTVTPTSIDEVEIASPEADLNEIENEVGNL